MILDNENANNLYIILSKIEDPRKKRGIRYKLQDLILLIIYGVLSGMKLAIEIQYYVEEHFEYFKELIGLKKVPSHDTFSRIISMLDFEKLGLELTEWLNEHYPEQIKYYNDKKVLHIDGKAVKAATKKQDGEHTVYLLNSMYEGGTISLYTNKIGDKENETTAIPKYLDKFNLEDTIVTIDAIGCNKTIIEKILSKKGSFVIPVKQNQKSLYNVIKNEVKRLKKDKLYNDLDKAEKKTKEHGRIENYSCTMIKDTKFLLDKLEGKSFFGQIARVGVIEKVTEKKEKGKVIKKHTITYVITNLEQISIENLLAIKLSHWSIESNHWILDIHLNEDRYTARKANATVNASIFKRFAMRVKKQAEKFKDIPLSRMFISGTCFPEKISKILFIDVANNQSLNN